MQASLTTTNNAQSGDRMIFTKTSDGYYISPYKDDTGAKVRKLMQAILYSDTLLTKKSIDNYKRIVHIAKHNNLSVHVKTSNYNMDVISKNGDYSIIIRCHGLLVYNNNGKLITQRTSPLVKRH
jgi:selenophosphate synthetase-related protein